MTAQIATPKPRSIYRVADCKHCGDSIENYGDGWQHEATSTERCDGIEAEDE